MYTKAGWKCCDEYNPTDNIEVVESIGEGRKHRTYKVLCKSCHHFLRLTGNPKIDEEIKKRNEQIDTLLLQRDDLKEKEISFLESIKAKRWLTPRQHTYFFSIINKFSN